MKKHLKHFIRLVNFEFERMFKFLMGIMIILVISNLAGFIIEPLNYVNRAHELMKSQSLNTQQYIERYNTFSLSIVADTLWVLGPTALGIVGLLFFSLFIWYREWFGKNTFAYRLLMLPVPRILIFFSKLLMIFLGTFSLLAIQLVMLWIGSLILPSMLSSEFYTAVPVSEVLNTSMIFSTIVPRTLTLFLGVYGLGLVGILVLFTAILLERSFQIKGLVLGILYCIASLGLITFPFMLPAIARNYFILFNSEIIILMSFFAVIVGLISLFVSRYLLKNKITI